MKFTEIIITGTELVFVLALDGGMRFKWMNRGLQSSNEAASSVGESDLTSFIRFWIISCSQCMQHLEDIDLGVGSLFLQGRAAGAQL